MTTVTRRTLTGAYGRPLATGALVNLVDPDGPLFTGPDLSDDNIHAMVEAAADKVKAQAKARRANGRV